MKSHRVRLVSWPDGLEPLVVTIDPRGAGEMAVVRLGESVRVIRREEPESKKAA